MHIGMESTDFETRLRALQREHKVRVLTHVGTSSHFFEDEGTLLAIGFVFGAIASGFLQAIGQDLWTKARELTREFFTSRSASAGSEAHSVVASFNYCGLEIVARLDVTSTEADRMTQHFGHDPCTLFWGSLPTLLKRLIREWESGIVSRSEVAVVLLKLKGSTMQWEETHHKKTLLLDPFCFTSGQDQSED